MRALKQLVGLVAVISWAAAWHYWVMEPEGDQFFTAALLGLILGVGLSVYNDWETE